MEFGGAVSAHWGGYSEQRLTKALPSGGMEKDVASVSMTCLPGETDIAVREPGPA